MGKIYKPSASLGNQEKQTIAMWFNVPNAGDGRYRLIEFGGGATNKRRSYIDVVANGTAVSIQSLFVGPVVSHNQHCDTDSRGPLIVNQGPMVRGTTKDGVIESSTFFDAWHHLAVAIDVNGWLPVPESPVQVYVGKGFFVEFLLPVGTVFHIFIPDFVEGDPNWPSGYPFATTAFQDFAGIPHPSALTPGDVVAVSSPTHSRESDNQVIVATRPAPVQVVKMRMVLDGVDQMEHHINFGPPWGDGLIDVTGEAIDFIETQANFASTDSFTGISTDNAEIGIPTQFTDWVSSIPVGSNKDENTALSVKHRYCDVQIWSGKFVDLGDASNLAKFFTITNGIGRPVNPRLASSAFGTPTFKFSGPSAKFATNLGTGGAFVKTGTINDFSPAPGQ